MNPLDARSVGVTIGKFNPPHLGHVHLIERGASEVDHLFVVLCDRIDQTLSAEDRSEWLRDACPANVTILTTPDDLPTANEPWAERVLGLLPHAPTIAFTSELWGADWAALMDAEHVLVDLDRDRVPISSTRIRADLSAHFSWLVPAARRALARRVVLVGAESTGKSTMAESLARELNTVWVPEHGRWYWEGRRHLPDQSWDTDEFRRIARAQRQLEADLARRATNGIVVSDTDALVTAAWHERYTGSRDPDLERLAAEVSPDLYLVCAPDFAWVQDGTRESREFRATMHEAMLERAESSTAEVVCLTGSHEERLDQAREAVGPLTRFPALV